MKFNDLMLRVLAKEKSDRPPVWLMRQAGRYMSEYRAIRSKVSFLEVCKTPDIAYEVTLQPVDVLGVDAAILFSDILIPVEPMGVNLSFNPAPVISNPVRTRQAANNLRVINPKQDVPFVYKTIEMLVKKLKVPLIGFSGAPFTLACYMVEGAGSKSFIEVKKLMHNDPQTYAILMEKLTESTILYLQHQINSGCPVVQIFDTWAAILSPVEYRENVLPYVQEIISQLKNAHVIYFAKDGSQYFDDIKKLKCTGIGLDWKIDIDKASKLLDGKFCLQGNLDPALLFTDKPTIKRFVEDIIAKGRHNPAGHIFNLGHGIMPETPVENVKYLVDIIKGA